MTYEKDTLGGGGSYHLSGTKTLQGTLGDDVAKELETKIYTPIKKATRTANQDAGVIAIAIDGVGESNHLTEQEVIDHLVEQKAAKAPTVTLKMTLSDGTEKDYTLTRNEKGGFDGDVDGPNVPKAPVLTYLTDNIFTQVKQIGPLKGKSVTVQIGDAKSIKLKGNNLTSKLDELAEGKTATVTLLGGTPFVVTATSDGLSIEQSALPQGIDERVISNLLGNEVTVNKTPATAPRVAKQPETFQSDINDGDISESDISIANNGDVIITGDDVEFEYHDKSGARVTGNISGNLSKIVREEEPFNRDDNRKIFSDWMARAKAAVIPPALPQVKPPVEISDGKFKIVGGKYKVSNLEKAATKIATVKRQITAGDTSIPPQKFEITVIKSGEEAKKYLGTVNVKDGKSHTIFKPTLESELFTAIGTELTARVNGKLAQPAVVTQEAVTTDDPPPPPPGLFRLPHVTADNITVELDPKHATEIEIVVNKSLKIKLTPSEINTAGYQPKWLMNDVAIETIQAAGLPELKATSGTKEYIFTASGFVTSQAPKPQPQPAQTEDLKSKRVKKGQEITEADIKGAQYLVAFAVHNTEGELSKKVGDSKTLDQHLDTLISAARNEEGKPEDKPEDKSVEKKRNVANWAKEGHRVATASSKLIAAIGQELLKSKDADEVAVNIFTEELVGEIIEADKDKAKLKDIFGKGEYAAQRGCFGTEGNFVDIVIGLPEITRSDPDELNAITGEALTAALYADTKSKITKIKGATDQEVDGSNIGKSRKLANKLFKSSSKFGKVTGIAKKVRETAGYIDGAIGALDAAMDNNGPMVSEEGTDPNSPKYGLSETYKDFLANKPPQVEQEITKTKAKTTPTVQLEELKTKMTADLGQEYTAAIKELGAILHVVSETTGKKKGKSEPITAEYLEEQLSSSITVTTDPENGNTILKLTGKKLEYRYEKKGEWNAIGPDGKEFAEAIYESVDEVNGQQGPEALIAAVAKAVDLHKKLKKVKNPADYELFSGTGVAPMGSPDPILSLTLTIGGVEVRSDDFETALKNAVTVDSDGKVTARSEINIKRPMGSYVADESKYKIGNEIVISALSLSFPNIAASLIKIVEKQKELKSTPQPAVIPPQVTSEIGIKIGDQDYIFVKADGSNITPDLVDLFEVNNNKLALKDNSKTLVISEKSQSAVPSEYMTATMIPIRIGAGEPDLTKNISAGNACELVFDKIIEEVKAKEQGVGAPVKKSKFTERIQGLETSKGFEITNLDLTRNQNIGSRFAKIAKGEIDVTLVVKKGEEEQTLSFPKRKKGDEIKVTSTDGDGMDATINDDLRNYLEGALTVVDPKVILGATTVYHMATGSGNETPSPQVSQNYTVNGKPDAIVMVEEDGKTHRIIGVDPETDVEIVSKSSKATLVVKVGAKGAIDLSNFDSLSKAPAAVAPKKAPASQKAGTIEVIEINNTVQQKPQNASFSEKALKSYKLTIFSGKTIKVKINPAQQGVSELVIDVPNKVEGQHVFVDLNRLITEKAKSQSKPQVSPTPAGKNIDIKILEIDGKALSAKKTLKLSQAELESVRFGDGHRTKNMKIKVTRPGKEPVELEIPAESTNAPIDVNYLIVQKLAEVSAAAPDTHEESSDAEIDDTTAVTSPPTPHDPASDMLNQDAGIVSIMVDDMDAPLTQEELVEHLAGKKLAMEGTTLNITVATDNGPAQLKLDWTMRANGKLVPKFKADGVTSGSLVGKYIISLAPDMVREFNKMEAEKQHVAEPSTSEDTPTLKIEIKTDGQAIKAISIEELLYYNIQDDKFIGACTLYVNNGKEIVITENQALTDILAANTGEGFEVVINAIGAHQQALGAEKAEEARINENDKTQGESNKVTLHDQEFVFAKTKSPKNPKDYYTAAEVQAFITTKCIDGKTQLLEVDDNKPLSGVTLDTDMFVRIGHDRIDAYQQIKVEENMLAGSLGVLKDALIVHVNKGITTAIEEKTAASAEEVASIPANDYSYTPGDEPYVISYLANGVEGKAEWKTLAITVADIVTHTQVVDGNNVSLTVKVDELIEGKLDQMVNQYTGNKTLNTHGPKLHLKGIERGNSAIIMPKDTISQAGNPFNELYTEILASQNATKAAEEAKAAEGMVQLPEFPSNIKVGLGGITPPDIKRAFGHLKHSSITEDNPKLSALKSLVSVVYDASKAELILCASEDGLSVEGAKKGEDDLAKSYKKGDPIRVVTQAELKGMEKHRDHAGVVMALALAYPEKLVGKDAPATKVQNASAINGNALESVRGVDISNIR